MALLIYSSGTTGRPREVMREHSNLDALCHSIIEASLTGDDHGVVDPAAAVQLPGTSLDPRGPVAFWGWSSGGQPSASAAELAPSYTAGVNLGRPARRYHPVAAVRRRQRNYTTPT